ncbi:MAG: ATP-binding protein [Nitrospirota bacterium]|nr:ATP-binding protein [Nitrospirota bacterium]
MGETRVDLLHLLEDLRDAYPGALEETIITEIVANSLDSGARHIRFMPDAAQMSLTVVDDGAGMQRKDLIRYHDLATSAKQRGQGIGFAGVGIKLSLLICEEVITETRRQAQHIATRWFLAGRHKAPWKWMPPLGLVGDRGTAVKLQLQNGLSPLLDAGFIEATLRRCYRPLLDPAFDEVLREQYPEGIVFVVNGSPLEKEPCREGAVARLAVCLARKRKPSVRGYLTRAETPLAEEAQGIAISTFGKVIKQGWDWLGLTPSTPDRIGGLIEVPDLAAALTLNKGDFVRTGARGALFLAYRKTIQEAVARQLAEWGDTREPTDVAKRRSIRPLERDLEQVLGELSEEFPLLISLVERKAGGQKTLPIGPRGEQGEGQAFVTASVSTQTDRSGDAPVEPPLPQESEGQPSQGPEPFSASPALPGGMPAPGKSRRSRPMRYGLELRFESRPDDPELGRLIESSVVINQGHPTYRRAVASRSEGYHIALCVALAVARLAAEPKESHTFVTTFMTRWGEALEGPRPRAARRR